MDRSWIVYNEDEGSYMAEQELDKLPEGFKPEELTRERFSYLGDWKLFMDQEGRGLAYRVGVMSGLTDKEGDPMEIYFHFGVPICKKDRGLAEDELKEVYDKLRIVIRTASQMWSQAHRDLDVISLAIPPPEYMLEELKKELYG